jgi:hypothetical protein
MAFMPKCILMTTINDRIAQCEALFDQRLDQGDARWRERQSVLLGAHRVLSEKDAENPL